MANWVQRVRSSWLTLLLLLVTLVVFTWTILGYLDLAELLRLVN